jgi:AraC-like DNA-binding protein
MSETLRGVVPTTYVRLLYEYLAARGVDAVSLLGAPAPVPGAAGPGRFPVVEWQRMIETAAAHLDDPLLGLHLGQTIAPRHFGVLGYVLLACDTLGAALARFQQYERLLYDVSPMRVQAQADRLVFEWGVERGRPGALVDECALAALVQFARDISGVRLAPLRVVFVNPPPPSGAPYETYFGCPVGYGAESTQVVIPTEWLGLPLREPDPGLLEVLGRQADALLEDLPPGNELEMVVRNRIVRLLREGEPGLERVAASLHMSARTLHRRLAEQGLQFRPLLEDTRRRLALDYLHDRRLHLSEIAELLGYAEQSAFSRAFRRWTGSSPSAYRGEVRRGG